MNLYELVPHFEQQTTRAGVAIIRFGRRIKLHSEGLVANSRIIDYI